MAEELPIPQVPEAKPDDPEDVSWALSTAEAMWARGDHSEGIKWVRRAAEAASEAEKDLRALELAKAAADLQGMIARMSGVAKDEAAKGGSGTSPGIGATGTTSTTGTTGTTSTGPHRAVPSVARPSGAAPPNGPGASSPPNAAGASVKPPVPGSAGSARPPVPARSGPPPSALVETSKHPVMSAETVALATSPTRAGGGGEATVIAPHDAITGDPGSEKSPPQSLSSDMLEEEEDEGSTGDRKTVMGAPPTNLARGRDHEGAANANQTPREPHGGRGPQGRPGAQDKMGSGPAPATLPRGARPPSVVPHDPAIQTSQAIRVVVWRDANGVHVAPAGTPEAARVTAIKIDAVLVALEPTADLTAWLSRRER